MSFDLLRSILLLLLFLSSALCLPKESQSFIPRHLASQCPVSNKSYSILSHSNYLAYLTSSYIFAGEEYSSKTINRNFALVLQRSPPLGKIPKMKEIDIAIFCPSGACENKLRNFVKSKHYRRKKKELYRPEKVSVHIIVMTNSFKKTSFPTSPNGYEIEVKHLNATYHSFSRYRNPEPINLQMGRYIEKNPGFFFLPDSFFDHPFFYFYVIHHLKKIDKKKTYTIMRNGWFLSTLILPSQEFYVDYVNLMNDAGEDWAEKITLGYTTGRKKLFTGKGKAYTEVLKFMNESIKSQEEFRELVGNAFVYRILLKRRDALVIINQSQKLMGKINVSKNLISRLLVESSIQFSKSSHFRFSSKYLSQKIFRSEELSSFFHQEHLERYKQFDKLKGGIQTLGGSRNETGLLGSKLEDVVITFGAGISLNQSNCLAFFQTFREFHPSTDLIVFTYENDFDNFSSIAKTYKIQLEAYDKYAKMAPKSNYSKYDNLGRFRITYEFLKRNPKYGRVFQTDLTDTLFQGSLFKIAPAFNEFSLPFVHFNREDILDTRTRKIVSQKNFEKKKNSQKYRTTLFALFGRIDMVSSFDWPRICAGTIIGDRNSFLQLIGFLLEQFEPHHFQGWLDEMTINHLVAKWPNVFPFSKLPNGFLFIRMLSINPSPKLKLSFSSAYIDERQRKLCYPEFCPAVIHQYDEMRIQEESLMKWTDFQKLLGVQNFFKKQS